MSTPPSAYTKYHKKYHHKNKNKLNPRRMRRYYHVNYGIPVDRKDLWAAFDKDKALYIKLRGVARKFHSLNPELIDTIIAASSVDGG